jgi:hypothetical protein
VIVNHGGERHRRDQSNGDRESGRESGDPQSVYRPLPPPSKETFLLLERHRPASAIDLSPRGLRPSRRYENLLLAAAVGEMQRDCLLSTPDCEWTARGGRRALLGVLGLSRKRLAVMLERTGERLSHQQKVRAQVRARQRFEEICLEVTAQGLRPETPPVEPATDRPAHPSPVERRPKAAIAATSIPALALAGSSKAIARLRASVPEGRMQAVSTVAAFTVLALGVGLTGWPFGGSHDEASGNFPGIGVGGVSAAQGASSHTAQLEAFRSAHSRAHPRDAGRRTADSPGGRSAAAKARSKRSSGGAGESGRCDHPLDGLDGPGQGTSGGGAPSGGGSNPSPPSASPSPPPASNPTGVVHQAVTAVQHVASQPNPASQAAAGATSAVKHTASGVKQTVSGATGGVLGN